MNVKQHIFSILKILLHRHLGWQLVFCPSLKQQKTQSYTTTRKLTHKVIWFSLIDSPFTALGVQRSAFCYGFLTSDFNIEWLPFSFSSYGSKPLTDCAAMCRSIKPRKSSYRNANSPRRADISRGDAEARRIWELCEMFHENQPSPNWWRTSFLTSNA